MKVVLISFSEHNFVVVLGLFFRSFVAICKTSFAIVSFLSYLLEILKTMVMMCQRSDVLVTN